VGLAWDPAAGIIAGGVIGPLLGMAVRPGVGEYEREGQLAFGPAPAHDHEHAIPYFPQRAEHAHDDPEAGNRAP
jgi:hypothetical protein